MENDDTSALMQLIYDALKERINIDTLDLVYKLLILDITEGGA